MEHLGGLESFRDLQDSVCQSVIVSFFSCFKE